MRFTLEAKQVIYKYFEVEAVNEDDALDIANDMVIDGEIHFDDEPFLKMEYNVKLIR